VRDSTLLITWSVTWSFNFNWPFYLFSGSDGIVIIFYTWNLYWFNYYTMKKMRTRIAIIVKPSFGLLQDNDKYTIIYNILALFQSHGHVKKNYK